MLAGLAAGCLGAMLGLGGGIFLVPVLHRLVDVPFDTATSISLVTIIGTSSVVSLASAGRQFVNIRLAVVLQTLTVLGATIGSYIIEKNFLSGHTKGRIFGATALLVAIVMLSRLNRRNVIRDPKVDPGQLGGRFHDHDSGEQVVYRLRRLPVALGMSLSAGVLSSLVGVGGGVLIVPALNSWCGIPLRVAAATSALMIGITAVPGVIGHYQSGHLTQPVLAAAAVIGVLIGSRAGFWLGPRSGVRSLKILMAAILLIVAVEYLFVATQ